MLILRGEIPRPIGDFVESLSQAMLVGIMLVGRLDVVAGAAAAAVAGSSSRSTYRKLLLFLQNLRRSLRKPLEAYGRM